MGGKRRASGPAPARPKKRSRNDEPKVRHITRWTANKDIALLCAIIKELRVRSLSLNMDEVAAWIGPNITGNAVEQHIGKLHLRLVAMHSQQPGLSHVRQRIGPNTTMHQYLVMDDSFWPKNNEGYATIFYPPAIQDAYNDGLSYGASYYPGQEPHVNNGEEEDDEQLDAEGEDDEGGFALDDSFPSSTQGNLQNSSAPYDGQVSDRSTPMAQGLFVQQMNPFQQASDSPQPNLQSGNARATSVQSSAPAQRGPSRTPARSIAPRLPTRNVTYGMARQPSSSMHYGAGPGFAPTQYGYQSNAMYQGQQYPPSSYGYGMQQQQYGGGYAGQHAGMMGGYGMMPPYGYQGQAQAQAGMYPYGQPSAYSGNMQGPRQATTANMRPQSSNSNAAYDINKSPINSHMSTPHETPKREQNEGTENQVDENDAAELKNEESTGEENVWTGNDESGMGTFPSSRFM